jgi:hypothetical protein
MKNRWSDAALFVSLCHAADTGFFLSRRALLCEFGLCFHMRQRRQPLAPPAVTGCP